MPITIRKATVQDFAAILSLIQEFSIFQGAADKVTVTLEQMQQDSALFQCFIAETEAKSVVGFASFFFAYYSWSGKALYLDDLFVKEAFRKKGIGKKLLQAVIEEATTQNCKKVRWQVSGWNTNAIQFYRKMGATIDGTELNCDLLLHPANP